MKDALKPCPCCGNKAEVIYDSFNVYRVECPVCGIATPRKARMETAIAIWNRREQEQPTAEPGTYEYYIKKMPVRNLAIFLYRFWKTWYQYHGEQNAEAIDRIEDWLMVKRRVHKGGTYENRRSSSK